MGRNAYPWAYRIRKWEQVNRRPHPLCSRLSARGREGLRYATEIAGAARARRFAAIGREHPDYDDDRVTAEVLARESHEQVSATTVRGRIQQATFELFESRSDRSIRRLLASVEKETSQKAGWRCEVDGCEEPRPPRSTTRKRYCAWHSEPWAKQERYRRKRRPPA